MYWLSSTLIPLPVPSLDIGGELVGEVNRSYPLKNIWTVQRGNGQSRNRTDYTIITIQCIIFKRCEDMCGDCAIFKWRGYMSKNRLKKTNENTDYTICFTSELTIIPTRFSEDGDECLILFYCGIKHSGHRTVTRIHE